MPPRPSSATSSPAMPMTRAPSTGESHPHPAVCMVQESDTAGQRAYSARLLMLNTYREVKNGLYVVGRTILLLLLTLTCSAWP